MPGYFDLVDRMSEKAKARKEILEKICDRIEKEGGRSEDRQTRLMDLSCLLLTEPEADLEWLLASDPFDFRHDINGINRHLDHVTGQLTDCFLPRCCRGEGYKKAHVEALRELRNREVTE